MSGFIRSTAKAIVLHEGRVLLNHAADAYRGDFYALPGGGQHRFETLEDAVVRECLEETGCRVRPPAPRRSLRGNLAVARIPRGPSRIRAPHAAYFPLRASWETRPKPSRPSRTAAHTASNGCLSARWAAARSSLPC